MTMDALTYIKRCEGFTPVAIPDTDGKWAVGYGFDAVHGAPVRAGCTMTRTEADAYFPKPFSEAEAAARRDIGPTDWDALDLARRAAITDMAYEMGGAGLAGFVKMLAAIRRGDWPAADDECMESAGYGRSPLAAVRERAGRAAYMMLTGEWPSGYGR